MVGDGDVVRVVVDGAEFVQGVERFFELSGGRGIWGFGERRGVVVVGELLSPSLL
jgi:hypothetical protein